MPAALEAREMGRTLTLDAAGRLSSESHFGGGSSVTGPRLPGLTMTAKKAKRPD